MSNTFIMLDDKNFVKNGVLVFLQLNYSYLTQEGVRDDKYK